MQIILIVVCWTLAVYFFTSANIGVYLGNDRTSINLLLNAFAVFLFLIPFAKSLSLGSLLKFESSVEKIESDIRDIRTTTQNISAIQASIVSNISHHFAQNLTFNLPALSEARKAERELDKGSKTSTQYDDRIEKYIGDGLSDPNVALAKLRMDLEHRLRIILNLQTSLGDPIDAKFRALRSLWEEFFKKFPDKRFMGEAFAYVNDVCNAAIHGQIVPREHAEEALSVGFRLLDELKEVGQTNPSG